MTIDIFEQIFDSLPIIAMIVDEDVRLQKYNKMASVLFGDKPETIIRHRGGDALHCLNAVTVKDGCGTAESCAKCIIRNSVKEACKGRTIFRETTVFQFLTNNNVNALNIIVTTVPLSGGNEKRVLLMLEDISEILQLRSIIPICAHCKSIRTESDLWKRVEEYFNTHTGADFTHTICPTCMEKLYPELSNKKD